MFCIQAKNLQTGEYDSIGTSDTKAINETWLAGRIMFLNNNSEQKLYSNRDVRIVKD